ncbi:MAG: hypothetical protein ACXWFY_02715 [Chthoniobacterales bacterium]
MVAIEARPVAATAVEWEWVARRADRIFLGAMKTFVVVSVMTTAIALIFGACSNTNTASNQRTTNASGRFVI